VPRAELAGALPQDLSIELLHVPPEATLGPPELIATPDMANAELLAVMPRLDPANLPAQVQRHLFDG